jgi:phosphatidate cytidylyltransferase
MLDPAAYALAGIFAAGLVLLLALTAAGRATRALWVAYAVELPIVLAVLIPAYLGGAVLASAIVALVVLTARELIPALRLAGLGALAASGLGFMYPAIGAAFLALLAAPPAGFGLVLFLYALVEVGDAFALLVGKLVGRRRLWPRLSPGKTLEGSLGGLVASLIVALLLAFAVPDWSTERRLAIGLVVAIAGQAGDLVASAFKRAAGIKDYGNAVPANGGVLDVYDSLIFAAPFMYLASAI